MAQKSDPSVPPQQSSDGEPVLDPHTPPAEVPLHGYVNRGAAGYPSPDEAIQQAVLEALIEEPELDAREVAVSAEQSVVTLAGSVASTAARELALRLAEGVPGVERVNDRLRVGSPPANGAR